MRSGLPPCLPVLWAEHEPPPRCLQQKETLLYLPEIKQLPQKNWCNWLLSFWGHTCLICCLFFGTLAVTAEEEIPVYQLTLVGWTAPHSVSSQLPGEAVNHSANQRLSQETKAAAQQFSQQYMLPEIKKKKKTIQRQISKQEKKLRKVTTSSVSSSKHDSAQGKGQRKDTQNNAQGTAGMLNKQQGDGGIYTPGQLDCLPRVLKRVRPEYPKEARKKKIEGRVVIRLIVDSNGLPTTCIVHSADPPGYFEATALETVHKMRFSPGKKNGRAVRTVVLLPFNFKLR